MNADDRDEPLSDDPDDWDTDDWNAYLLPHNDAFDAEYEEELDAYALAVEAEEEAWEDAKDYWVELEHISQAPAPPPAWILKLQQRGDREKAYWINKDGWEAVKVAADWKHAHQPERALAFAHEIRKAGIKLERPPWEAFVTTIASSHRQLGALEKSLQRAMVAIDSNPEKPHAYRVAGAALRRLGQHDKAQTYFEKANALDPVSNDATNGS